MLKSIKSIKKNHKILLNYSSLFNNKFIKKNEKLSINKIDKKYLTGLPSDGVAYKLNNKNQSYSKKIFSTLLSFVWPENDVKIRKRVTLALGLLFSAKVLNTSVPFFFKHAVDTLSEYPLINEVASNGFVMGPVALIIGCKIFLILKK